MSAQLPLKVLDYTDHTGSDLKALIEADKYKYKIFIKSTLYNSKGAYWPFESTYLVPTDKLYSALTQQGTLKNLYVSHYNNVKPMCEKATCNSPPQISENNIESINIYVLPLSYCDYYR